VVQRTGFATARLDAPFARSPVFLFLNGGATLLVGNTGSSRIDRYRSGGRLLADGGFDLGIQPGAISPDAKTRWVDSVRSRLRAELDRSALAADQKSQFQQLHDRLIQSVAFPETRNSYQLAVLDDTGNLWVQLDLALADGASRWQVHRVSDGRLLRTVDVPTRGTIKAAAPTRNGLYVVEVGSDGVGRVARYAPIVRRPAARSRR
jgi:hypothetical protein